MTTLSTPPVLSTPETHVFEDPTPTLIYAEPKYADEELNDVYEIQRTAREVREGGFKRVAMQFPDGMLRDAPRVFQSLEVEVEKLPVAEKEGTAGQDRAGKIEELETSFNHLSASTPDSQIQEDGAGKRERVRFYILADTSYGSCCVDEIAAEHVDADVVVHYGRSCLSPTARLPVIYVFTTRPLNVSSLLETFESTFPEKDEKVVLMADITYHSHITSIHEALKKKGYMDVLAPEVIHDPSSQIPNRRIDEDIELKEYDLFHISEPPNALLLTLNSRVKEMYIYPTKQNASTTKTSMLANTSSLLRRRYALLTRLSTAPILGILINTLSVANYLSTSASLRQLISSAGKKSYTFVVGKVNAAKIANFSEIGGWVVVGCWESSLVEGGEFFRGVVTPFELGVALTGNEMRIWDGRWEGGFGGVEEMVKVAKKAAELAKQEEEEGLENGEDGGEDEHEGEDSAPPEFDLRTGRYVSHSRPMRASHQTSSSSTEPSEPSSGAQTETSKVLTRRAKGDIATINGAVSPGAEYLRSQRMWTGLGSDFVEVEEEGGLGDGIEEGRGGIARGYRVGRGGERT